MIAVALSPKARALIRANRNARRPTAEDRERVTAALRARLGATVLPLDTPTSIPIMGTGIQRRFAAAFGLCVVGSALFLARRPAPALESTMQIREQSVEAIPSATSVSPPNPISPHDPVSTPVETTATPERATAPSAPSHAPPKVARTPPQDTLAQELALLTSAASQLSAGQANGALLALEEHQRRFSRGVLSDERNLAKARALCMLHRFDEGRAALARLAAGTPAAARVKEDCDSAWARASRADLSHERE
jgi:hypothetical protein